MATSKLVDTKIMDLTISDEEDTSFIDCKLRPNQQLKLNGKESLRTEYTTNLQIPKINGNLKTISNPSTNVNIPLPTIPNSQRMLCPKELRIKLPKIAIIDVKSIEPLQPDSVDVVAAKPTARYGLRNRVPPQVNVVEKKAQKANTTIPKRNGIDKDKPLPLEQSWEWSSSARAREFDILHNFFPEPGPSHINYYEHMDLSVYYNKSSQAIVDPVPSDLPAPTVKDVSKPTNGAVKIGPKLKTAPKRTCNPIVINTLLRPPTFDYVLDAMPNYGIPYCFDSSMNINKDIDEDFKSDVVPGKGWLAKRNAYETSIDKQSKKPTITIDETTILQSLLRPPNFDEVLDTMHEFDIPWCSSQEPFYGNSSDATARKEISISTVLHIPTQTLDDIEDFVSESVECNGFVATRNDLFTKLMGSVKLLSHSDIRCKLASTTDICKITPSQVSPTFTDAERWLHEKSPDPIEIDLLADSPIKVARISPTITIGGEDDAAVEFDVVLKMSQLSQTAVTENNVIEASPTSKLKTSLSNGRLRNRVRRRPISGQKSTSMVHAAPVDSRNDYVDISSDEVICVDDDDDVVVCEDRDRSQLFSNSRAPAKKTTANGNVLVSKC